MPFTSLLPPRPDLAQKLHFKSKSPLRNLRDPCLSKRRGTLANRSGSMAIISDFQEEEAPQQAARGEEALAAVLEQSGGGAMFLQAAINVALQRSDFFCDPSAVSKVTAMASAARAQVEAEEREAKRKAQDAERKAKAAAAPAPAPAPTGKAGSSEEKADTSVEKKDNMEVGKEDSNVRSECCSSI
jgi:hypothetical protein